MNYIEKNKKEAETYRKLELIEFELSQALKETRREPGFSILDIVKVMKKVLKPEEIAQLRKELK